MRRRMLLSLSLLLLPACGFFSRQPSTPTSDADLARERAAQRPAPDARVAEAQRKLKEAGFDPGGDDGVLGQRTRSALQDFQRAKGLRVTGELDGETRESLGVRPR